jgi:hypothetical protein
VILLVVIRTVLIKKAISNLEEAAASEDYLEQGCTNEPVIVRSCDNTEERCDEAAGNGLLVEADGETPCSGSKSLLQKVKFRQEQFIEDFPHGDYKKDGTFDTVLW